MILILTLITEVGLVVRRFIKFMLFQLLTGHIAFAYGTPAETKVVTGTRSEHRSWDSPIPTESVVLDDARQRGKQTLADALADEPGLEIVPALRGQSIRLQGLDSKYVLILIDGQRVTGEVGESFDLTSLSLDQVERVEIVRGAASSLYGSDGIGGVVNVILRRPRTNRQDLRLRWGTDRGKTLGGQASFVRPGSDHTITLTLAEQDPWHRTAGPATQFSGTRQGDLSWQNNWSPADDWSLKTSLGFQAQTIEGTDVSPVGAIWDRENRIQKRRFALSPEKRFDQGSVLKLDSQYQDYHDVYQTVARFQTSERTREETLETLQEHTLTLQHEAGSDHLFTWGLTHIKESLHSDRLESDTVQRKRNAFFVQDEWSLGSDLTLVPGLRADDDSQFGEHLSGKLAARYALSEDTILRSSYGEGYRAPAFKELYLRFENISVGYDVLGNPDLKPEVSRSLQLALDHRIKPASSVSVNVFRSDLTDLIEATRLEASGEGIQHYGYQNVASARNQGVDLTWRWQGSRVDTTISYQYLDARDRTRDRALDGRSRDTVAAKLQRFALHDHWQLHGGIRWIGPQPPDKSRSALYAHAGVFYSRDSSWSSSLTLENLTNSWEDRLLQVRPRSLILTLNWNHEKERT
jgi:outer membrane receptor for ferrienterochelin and colicins